MNSSQRQPGSLVEQDLELLSAYLDQELTAAERVNLERRLGAESRLQSELDDLRSVRAALRDLDPIPTPRSFALDPAKVARPRPFLPLTWFMQMGSGLAGLALVLLATAQLLAGGMGGGAAMAPMPAAQSAPMSASTDMRVAEATSAPAATEAPAAAAPAPEAPAAAMAAPTAAPAAEAADAGASAASGVAGGVDGGPESNSAGGMGGAPEIDATIDAMQSAESSSPDTADPAIDPLLEQPAPKQAPEGGAGAVSPTLTLALGIGLLALAIGWNVASRRRA